jgi:hypothetical protein
VRVRACARSGGDFAGVTVLTIIGMGAIGMGVEIRDRSIG